MADTAVKVLERPDPTALGELVSAEMAKQIETAKRYPRDADKGLRELVNLSTRADAVAEACMYSLKRQGKEGLVFITGPSVRFAELLAYCWGNLRWGARIIDEGARAVVAQGLCYDLERNTGGLVEIRRGILTSTGNRFGADMINVTSNAACSIATRNAIFDVIPQVLWWEAYEAVKERAIGAGKIPERIQQAVQFFISKGAKQEDILHALGVKAIKDMGRDHLEIFIGLRTAMKEGGIKIETIFTPEGAEERHKLSMVAEEDQFNGIDKQLQGGGAKQKGGDQKAAAQRSGDSGKSEKTKPAAAKAGSGGKKAPEKAGGAAAPKEQQDSGPQVESTPAPATRPTAGKVEDGPAKADAGSPSGAGETDAEFVDRIDRAHSNAPRGGKSKVIRQAKGELERISKSGDDKAAAAKADKLLDLYDLENAARMTAVVATAKLMHTWAANAIGWVRSCKTANELCDWLVANRYVLFDCEQLAPSSRATLQLEINNRFQELDG